MEKKAVIKFGLFLDSEVSFDNTEFTSFLSLDKNNVFGSTMNQIAKIDGKNIKNRTYFPFSAATIIKEYELIVGIEIRASQIFIFHMRDITYPLISGFPTNQMNISHLIYSPKSSILATCGNRIKTWNIHITQQGRESDLLLPTIKVTERCVFKGNFRIGTMNPPGFDYTNEYIFLPTEEGVRSFTLDGVPLVLISKFPFSMSTVYSYNELAEVLFTYDPTQGSCVWSKTGTLIKRIPFGGQSITYCNFLNSEDLLIMNSEGSLFILNIISNKSLFCYSPPYLPSAVFISDRKDDQLIGLAVGTSLQILRVSFPWSVWASNVTKANRMIRCEKRDEAARILVQTQNSFAKIYSPKDATLLTVATPLEALTPSSYFYDRESETLFMVLDNGQVYLLDAMKSPCAEKKRLSLHATNICSCKYLDQNAYVISHLIGDITFYDTNFEQIKHFSLTNMRIYSIFYVESNNCILVHFSSEVVLFSCEKFEIIARTAIAEAQISGFNRSFVIFGDKEGNIQSVSIKGKFLTPAKQFKAHVTEITSFSFANSFWISTSIDGIILIWDYNFNKTNKINSPFPVYSACSINGNRDVILALDTVLMRINGSMLFQEEDAVDKKYDNFNEKDDPLALKFEQIAETNEQSNTEAIPKALSKKIQNFKKVLLEHQIQQQQQFGLIDTNHPNIPRSNNREKIIEEMQRQLGLYELNQTKDEPPIPKFEAVIKPKPEPSNEAVVEPPKPPKYEVNTHFKRHKAKKIIKKKRHAAPLAKEVVNEEDLKPYISAKNQAMLDSLDCTLNINELPEEEEEEKIEEEPTETIPLDNKSTYLPKRLRMKLYPNLQIPEIKVEEPAKTPLPSAPSPIIPVPPSMPIPRMSFPNRKSRPSRKNSIKVKPKKIRQLTPPTVRRVFTQKPLSFEIRAQTPSLKYLEFDYKLHKFVEVIDVTNVKDFNKSKKLKKKKQRRRTISIKRPPPIFISESRTKNSSMTYNKIRKSSTMSVPTIPYQSVPTTPTIQYRPFVVTKKEDISEKSLVEYNHEQPKIKLEEESIEWLAQQLRKHHEDEEKAKPKPQKKAKPPPELPKKKTLKLSDTIRRIREIEQSLVEPEKDLLVWRGVPRKLPRYQVYDIDQDEDEQKSTLANDDEKRNNSSLSEIRKKKVERMQKIMTQRRPIVRKTNNRSNQLWLEKNTIYSHSHTLPAKTGVKYS